jgi:phage/plasmid primase-like uncharacterized protein
MLAAVTDIEGKFTGLQRTWLAADGTKASIDPPRRALGRLAGNAVRFGELGPVAIIAEGIETALSVRTAVPLLPVMAALSAAHLRLLELWPSLRSLVIATDYDDPGVAAANHLSDRATAAGIPSSVVAPRAADWNDELVQFGDRSISLSLAG